jgi:two-component system, cell cycle sensor histidine kinase and response regulator CckA
MSIVLIVEDDEAVRVLTQSVIEEMGHIGLTAANPEEAAALLAGERSIALLLTDLDMAGNALAGVELAKEAVQTRPGLPVLYTSAAGATDGTRALFVAGSDFLPKPYTVPQLTEAVTKMLRANNSN